MAHIVELAETHFDAWIGLVGVVIGFVLSTGQTLVADFLRRRRLRRALEDELRANLRAFTDKLDIIYQWQQHRKNNLVFDMRSVPFLRAIYDGHYAELVQKMTAKERNVLHFVYSYFATVDATMAQFGDDIAGKMPPEADNIIARYDACLADFAPLASKAEELINSFLAGMPVDVARVDTSLEEVKKTRRVPNG